MSHDWTKDQKSTVERFSELMERRDWSQPDAAKRLGVSPATLSQMLNHSYEGRVDAICDTMQRVMRHAELRAHAPSDPPYATTSVSEQVIEVLGLAHAERRLACILGPTGVGKTKAVERYRDHEPDTIYVVSGPSCSPYSLTRQLAADLNIDCANSTYDRRIAIAEALADSDRLLVIDEIDYPNEKTLQCLRLIYDQADVGMVLIGTASFLEKIRRRKSSTAQQFLGRVAYARRVHACSDDDLARIAEPYDLDDDALDALAAGACGQARRACNALIAAQRMADGDLSARAIRRAYETLMPVEVE